MIIFRKMLFLVFTIIYVIACPIIILDSLGIVLQPGKAKPIIATGLIFVSSLPAGAAVSINGKPFAESTPAIIRSLPPGDYHIKVTREHHRSWEKSVAVKNGQATALEDLLLAPDEWQGQAVTAQGFTQLIPVPSVPHILLKTGHQAKDLFDYHLPETFPPEISRNEDNAAAKEPAAVFPIDSPFYSHRLISLAVGPQSHLFLATVHKENKAHYLWVNLRPQPLELRDITDLFLVSPEEVLWDPLDDDNLFFTHKRRVYQIQVKSKTVFASIAQGITGIGVHKKKLYILGPAGIDEIDYLNHTQRPFPSAEPLPLKLFSLEGQYRIYVLAGDVLLFLNRDGQLLTSRPPYKLADSGVEGILPHPRDKKALCWTKKKLGVVDFDAVQSGAAEKGDAPHAAGASPAGPTVRWIVEYGRDIRQAFWVNHGTHVIYLDRDTLKLAEAQPYGPALVYSVTEVKSGSQVSYNDKAGRLFYLDPAGSGLASLIILPERKIFPEVTPQPSTKPKEE